MTATTSTGITSPLVNMPVVSVLITPITMTVMPMSTATRAARRPLPSASPNPVCTRSAGTLRTGGHEHRNGARQEGDQETSTTLTRSTSSTRPFRGPVRGKGVVRPHWHRAPWLRHTPTLAIALTSIRLARIITTVAIVFIMAGSTGIAASAYAILGYIAV